MKALSKKAATPDKNYRAAWTLGLREVPPQAILAIVLAWLGWLVYAPGLAGPFIFDDFPALVDNARVHVTSMDSAALRRAALSFDPGGLGRPLSMLSFAINHALGGLDPWSYKAVGLAVHLVNSVLVFAIVLRLFAFLWPAEGSRVTTAFVVAALWSIHPLQVSTVLYVVQRMETLSLAFVLAALLAYVRGRSLQVAGRRGWRWLLACAPLIGLGLAAKETAALFPAYALALELTVFRFRAQSVSTSRMFAYGYAIGVMVSITVFVIVILPHYGSAQSYIGRDFDVAQRLLSQLRILPLYLGQMLVPVPSLMPFYYDDFVASQGWFAPATTLLGGLLLLALLATAWRMRGRAPLFSLGIFWFFAAHLITSNVIPLELVFEHRNYFALLGIVLALTDVVRRIRVSDRSVAVIASVVLLLGVGALSAIRSATWGERLLLATDLASKNPDSARAAHDLGVIYFEMANNDTNSPFFSLAEQQFQREASLPNSTILAEQSLVLLAAQSGKAAQTYWDAMFMKLRTRPISSETTQALFALLENRNKGIPLDDRNLAQGFQLLFDRVLLPPYSYAEVGDHALLNVRDTAMARKFYLQAAEAGAAQRSFINALHHSLLDKGQPEMAAEIVAHASKGAKSPVH